MIKYENRHYWRKLTPEKNHLDFAGDFPTQAVTEVIATGQVVVRAVPVDSEGEAGEPFLVGVCEAGTTQLRVRHVSGFVLFFEWPKAAECWIYDDREDHQAVAPVGVPFTVFEMPGHIFNDPVQIVIQRDANLKALQRMAARDNPQPDAMAELRASNERLLARLEKLEKANEPEANAQPEPEQTT